MKKSEFENFEPYYFLDTGSDNIMYTLKHAQIDWAFVDGVQKPYIREHYIKNLSTDYQEAVKKAKEFIGNDPLYSSGEKQTNEWGTGNSNNSFGLSELSEEEIEEREKAKKALEEKERKEQEEYEKAEPIPETRERIKIEGLVLARYQKETQWGTTVKNIIQDDRGFKVCGTAVAEKDERVSFIASVEISKDDIKFGFYKRPKQVLLENENPDDYKMVYVDIQGWKEKEYAINLKWLYNAIKNEESLSKDKFVIQGAKSYQIEFDDLNRVKELIESKLSVEYLKGE